MRQCDICGKKAVVGRQITTRGLPKKVGGIGTKITGINKRRFKPNIQKVRVRVNGGTQRMRVCTRCIKSGRVQKAG
jgi:large subunit ribosomal protein L28